MGDAQETDENKELGFIVIDGNGVLFGILSGKTCEVIHKFPFDLPKKHERGGQSGLQFARLLMEKRHNYVRNTADLATQFYINLVTSQPFVSGLIIAGSDDFKTALSQSDMLDPRLKAIILKVVDVSYSGVKGFKQAIELVTTSQPNANLMHQERCLLRKYLNEIIQETRKYVYGIETTLKALKMGAVETLIVWENLDITRYTLKNSKTSELVIKHLTKEQESDRSNFRDTNAELEIQDKTSLLEWLTDEYKNFGCTLEYVTNKSPEGSQFCRGFGGIGGILRYKLDMQTSDELSDGETDDDSQYFMIFPINKLMRVVRASSITDKDQVKADTKPQQDQQQIDNVRLAEERLYSDMELTDDEIERMVMAESLAEFNQHQKQQQFSTSSNRREDCSTSSAQPEPSSSCSGVPSTSADTNTNMVISSSSSSSVQVLLSMGFSYTQAMEAYTIFGDDVDSMICYLLETGNTISSSSKGKAKLE